MAPSFSYDGTVTCVVNPNHFYIRLVSEEERRCNVEYIINGLKKNELKQPKLGIKLDLPDADIGDILQFDEAFRPEQFFPYNVSDEDVDETDVEPILAKALLDCFTDFYNSLFLCLLTY